MAAVVRQAPGWWPSLVRPECDVCGWVGQVRNLNSEGNTWGRVSREVRQEAEEHVCGGGGDEE